MPTSVRFSPDLQERIQDAAARLGVTPSAFIRGAVEERCQEVLGPNLFEALGDIIGSIDVEDDSSLRTGEVFGQLLEEQHRHGTL